MVLDVVANSELKPVNMSRVKINLRFKLKIALEKLLYLEGNGKQDRV